MSVQMKTEDGSIVDFSSITASFANVGAATSNPLAFIGAINATDQPVIVSIDGGATDSLPLPAYSAASLTAKDFDQFNKGVAQLEVGSQIQIKHNGTAPTKGSVSIIKGYAK